MPEARLQRMRETLPPNYKYGDMLKLAALSSIGARIRLCARDGHKAVGDALRHWNVIEGEHHE